MAGIDLALDVLRDIADAVDIGDRCSAEFHDETSHRDQRRIFAAIQIRRAGRHNHLPAQKGAYTYRRGRPAATSGHLALLLLRRKHGKPVRKAAIPSSVAWNR